MTDMELIVIDIPCHEIESLDNPPMAGRQGKYSRHRPNCTLKTYRAEVDRRLKEEITTRKLPKPLFVTGRDEGKVLFEGPDGALRLCYVNKFEFYYAITVAGKIVQQIYDTGV
uniref:Uncharacterized protein n=2 Tax=viral metagenome TaxID=1070528 RepID=A0A6M3JD57_9ZZZZ